ncbi:MAG: flavin monoamine oxidase family protein [Vicinamibacteraceae bacterium]
MTQRGTSVDRRTFLRLLSLAGSSVALSARQPSPAKRVVVLGAGLAGLASAWNLMRHGYEVVVLEAQGIPGGRVKTVREPFKKGGYAEAGALRIPNDHRWTMKYIELMGLASKLKAYDDDVGRHLWYLDGKRFTTPDGPWPLEGLLPKEKADPFALVPTYWGPGFTAVGDPTRPGFPDASARTLDRYRIDELFKKEGASDAWIKILLAEEGDVRRVNALAVTALFAAPDDGEWTKTYGLVGGNDQLPKAIAAKLGSRIKYGSPVLRLAHHDTGVVVTFRDRAGQQEIEADHCVCTLPFPVLRQVAITPAFSHQKMEAIHEYGLYTIARVYYQTRTRFWRHDPLGRLGGLNMIGTDTPAERIWNSSHVQPDNSMGMLQSYMADQRGLAFARIPPRDRVKESLKVISTFLPRLPGEVEATYVKVWHEDPWQKGAFAAIPPNAFGWMWPAARRAEGRVHFAGEHTSVWVGFQNGALESAERCVEEIVRGGNG